MTFVQNVTYLLGPFAPCMRKLNTCLCLYLPEEHLSTCSYKLESAHLNIIRISGHCCSLLSLHFHVTYYLTPPSTEILYVIFMCILFTVLLLQILALITQNRITLLNRCCPLADNEKLQALPVKRQLLSYKNLVS